MSYNIYCFMQKECYVYYCCCLAVSVVHVLTLHSALRLTVTTRTRSGKAVK